MKPIASIVPLAISILSTSCASVGQIPTQKLATATLHQANGAPAGSAIITAAGTEVSITIAVVGLPQGPHGMHLHAIGKCDAPAFTSAGAHLNPHARQHGLENPAGSHLGDLPGITANSIGAGTVTASLRGSREEIEAALFDADGTAIVVHAAADDNRTDPTGNSGVRIACGVLTR
ncbi:superoxide dismutase family protein [Novosphingobium sp.]|uniref:superoxide dismutase family protein n=1 Tax=Novosphingobium sp. TaxID=1874826 RepID=UPI0025CBE23B|nr:superoxide dismutase family protein [Novosphingobium sp.]MCC6927010.1 superoxide dismutase family protein [Novosphingobium sp.]